MIDYVADFPIPEAHLPSRLFDLLAPVSMEPELRVDVTLKVDIDQYGPNREYIQMIMAVVIDPEGIALSEIREISDGVVYYSQPDVDVRGGLSDFNITVSGHDYIVASNGNGGFYGYQLAEKVWIALGLSPRAIGGSDQKLYYDDLSAPEFGIADGEISSQYYYSSNRDVRWTMSNPYLRRYLWMRGAHAVRVFHYQKQFGDVPYLRALMNGEPHVSLKPQGGWYELDIREFKGGLLLQVWAIVSAVTPELCDEPNAEVLEWPGFLGPMSHDRANGLLLSEPVFLSDRFLQRYEQNKLYDCMPVCVGGRWLCSPSYLGQWGFTGCERVGRNLIKVSMRDLYKAIPDRELVHAHKFVVSPDVAARVDRHEEHIAAKTARLVETLLDLGENLEVVSAFAGLALTATEIVGISRAKIQADQWREYPEIRRIAQVAPVDMSEQEFLARCKSIHELWQKVPNGFLKTLLERCGYERDTVRNLGSLKLLQLFVTNIERLNENGERLDALLGSADAADASKQNSKLAALFKLNDLRIADAHHAGEALEHLENLGFDTSNVNQGYGRALDYVFDETIAAFAHINQQIEALLDR